MDRSSDYTLAWLAEVASWPRIATIGSMYPILGRYGSFFLYSYTVCWALALLLSWLWLRRHVSGSGSLIVLLAGLVGILTGRASFVAAHWSYYGARPAEIWQLTQGGIAAQPSLLMILLLLALNSWRGGRSPWGALTIPLTLAYSFGWVACYLEACGYGRETSLHPLAADLPDSFGVFALRYQTQLLGAAGALLLLGLVLVWQRRHGPRAQDFWLALTLLTGQQLFLLAYRGDPAPTWLGWRADGWMLLLTLLIALMASYYSRRR